MMFSRRILYAMGGLAAAAVLALLWQAYQQPGLLMGFEWLLRYCG